VVGRTLIIGKTAVLCLWWLVSTVMFFVASGCSDSNGRVNETGDTDNSSNADNTGKLMLLNTVNTSKGTISINFSLNLALLYIQLIYMDITLKN